jgi:hypothetical protein
MEYFEKLGSYTGQLWKKLDCDERRFPEAANDALAQMPPSRHTTFEEVVEHALTAETLPYQTDLGAEFGQPPLTVYESRDFRIEVLFWTGATPAIHQHAFSGAFHVMHGSSIHIAWNFDFQERVSTHLQFGRVHIQKAELLKLGDTRPIIAGNGFIHTTFHLDTPTLSVVVRTTNDQEHMPQYAYYPPSICYNPRDNEPYIRRKAQILAMLVNSGRADEHDRWIKELLDEIDTYSAFNYLYQAHLLRDKAKLEELLAVAKVRHPRLIENLAPALVHARRQAEITKIRGKVKATDTEVRFLLALLINITDHETILALMKERYAGADPVSKFVAAVKHLSDADLLGEKFTEPWLWMLECLLRGKTKKDEILKAFEDKYGAAQVEKQLTKIGNLSTTVGRFWLFRALFEHFPQDDRFVRCASAGNEAEDTAASIEMSA